MANQRLKIAVVDDEVGVRKALSRLFRSANMDVEAFATGLEFLDSLSTHQPDCLVLDLHMPGLTGRDVLRRLARKSPRLPTVVITGKDEANTREAVLADGADAYLLKPLDDTVLLDAVTAAARMD
jgi:FixJ family two-component response regulator